MQSININFIVPTGWHELTDKQLREVYSLIADNFSSDELKTLCLLRWSGTKVVGKQDKCVYLLQQGPPNIGKRLQDTMDAQIRALTQGDITKEKTILYLLVELKLHWYIDKKSDKSMICRSECVAVVGRHLLVVLSRLNRLLGANI